MAVFNNYVVSALQAGDADEGKNVSPLQGQGTGIKAGRIIFDTVAAWDALSIMRVLKDIPCTAVIKKLAIYTDGVTGMNDVNVGLYKPLRDGGAEVGVEVLGSAIDLSAAVLSTAYKDGMVNLANSDRGKALWELAGQTINNRSATFDIGLQSVNDITEADTIVVDYELFYP